MLNVIASFVSVYNVLGLVLLLLVHSAIIITTIFKFCLKVTGCCSNSEANNFFRCCIECIIAA